MEGVAKYWLIALVILFLPAVTHASASGLVIHAFQVSGDSGAYDEFVSISNESSNPISLLNYSISRKTKTATTWNTLYKFADTKIAPHQVLSIAHPKYTGISDFQYSTTSYSLAADNSIAVIAPDKTIVDLVGYGDAISFEGARLPNPDASEIFTRVTDTDNNLADFVSSVKTTTLDPNADKVIISELMPNPSEGSEWFELYNQTNLTVNLAGTKVCDGVGSVHCYFFANTDILGPNEYKTYSQLLTKITLNNDGDWLEFRDSNDNVLADTGGNYGSTDSGISLSLFGSVWQWTKTQTPAAQNIYTDTTEIEVATATSAKKSSAKTTVKKASTDKTPSTSGDVTEADATIPSTSKMADQGVKGASTTGDNRNRILGYSLLSLAVLLLLGYNLWDKRSYVRDLYYKISRRDH